MNNQNPATPAQAANPGSGEQMQQPSSVAPQTPTTGTQGEQQEEKVSISMREYRNLQRDHARVLSFEKRKQFNAKQTSYQTTNDEGDPQIAEELRRRDEALQAAMSELHRERVTGRVRDLLEKPEYQGLPKSTRDLILKNPSMLSESDNLEEAMLDIEDFVRDQVSELSTPTQQKGGGVSRNDAPPAHETPPAPYGGSPAPSKGIELEDISKLSGPARSRAILRNKMREANGIKNN